MLSGDEMRAAGLTRYGGSLPFQPSLYARRIMAQEIEPKVGWLVPGKTPKVE